MGDDASPTEERTAGEGKTGVTMRPAQEGGATPQRPDGKQRPLASGVELLEGVGDTMASLEELVPRADGTPEATA